MTRSLVVTLKTSLVLIMRVHHLNKGRVTNTDVALLAYIKPFIIISSFIACYFQSGKCYPLQILARWGLMWQYWISRIKHSQSLWPRHLRWSLCSWDCGFETRKGHGCLSLVSVVCCQVQEMSVRRDDHSSRGVLPREACLWVIPKPRKGGDPEPLGRSSHKNVYKMFYQCGSYDCN
jgi:hypothetical protein